MRIVVLAGGLSMERNVSLSSGTRICRALRERGHQAVLVDMFLGLEGYAGAPESIFDAPDGLCGDFSVAREEPDLDAVRASRKDKSENIFGKDVLRVCAMADVVFIALHGVCGEDGRVQAAFDLFGIPYTGSGYLGSAIAMDKDLTKRLVAPYVTTAKWRALKYTARRDRRHRRRNGAALRRQAQRQRLVHRRDDRAHARRGRRCADRVPALRRAGRIEQCIHGRELQVGILDGKALPAIEIIPKTGFYDYANKYQAGAAEEVCPAPIPAEWEKKLRSATETVFRVLELSVYSRADFIVTEDGTPYFLEINTLPGMTPTSLVPQEAAAAGIGYGEHASVS